MAGGYSVTITAVDRATKVIDGVNKRLAALQAPTERLQRSLGRFARLSGLSDLAEGMKRLANGGLDAFRIMSQLLIPLAQITGAASIAGMVRLASTWALWGQHLDITSKRVGIASDKLQELENVNKLAGGSAEGMDAGLKNLRDTMTAFVGGRASGEQVTLFHTLGIDMDFAKRAAADVGAVLPEMLAKIRQIRDPTLRATVAQAAFGSAAEDLLPLIGLTAEQYNKLTEAVKAHGLASAKDIENSRNLARSQENLEQSVWGLVNSILSATSGPLADMQNRLSRWIDLNRELIAQKVGQWFSEFVAWLDKIDWAKVQQGAQDVATNIGKIGGAIGGAIDWMDKMGITGEVLGGILLLKLLGPLTLVIAKLGWIAAFSPPAWMLAIMGIGGAVAGKMNLPTLDEYGRPTGNWGGAEGERNAARDNLPSLRGSGPESDTQSSSFNPEAGKFVPLGTKLYNWATGGGEGRGVRLDDAKSRANSAIGAKMLMDAGASREGAAAVLGNWQQESGQSPQAGNGQHQGIEQWDARRQARIMSEFSHGKPVTAMSYSEQVAASVWEMKTYQQDAWKLMQGHNLAAANDVMTRKVEAPGNYETEVPNRLALAQRQLQLIPQAPVASGPPVAIAPSAPGGTSADTPAPQNGQVSVTVRHENAPDGATVTARSSGDLMAGAPKIESSTRNIVRDGY